MAQTLTKAFLYIERGGFIYAQANNPTIARFTFAPTSVRDLEVVNPIELAQQIKLFVAQNKLPAASILVAIGENACFQKEFSVPVALADVADIQNYMNNVPFESVAYRMYPVDKKTIVVTANVDFYDALEQCFTDLGFQVSATIPFYAIKSANKTITALDNTAIATIFKQFDSLKNAKFLLWGEGPMVRESATSTTPAISTGGKTFPRIYLLALVFGLLIILLIVVYLKSQEPAVPAAPATPPPASAPASATSIPSASPSTVLSASPIPDESLIIQVNNGSSLPNQGELMKAGLASAGFKTITATNSAVIDSSNTLIVFSPLVSAATQEKIINTVKNLAGEVVVRIAANDPFDVVITLSRPSLTPTAKL